MKLATPRTLITASMIAASIIATIGPSHASAASYAVDGSHTSVVFSISHLGYSYTYGMFRKNSGSFEFDPDNPAACAFNFTVDVASLDTMDPKRDEHLRNADFFNAKQFPQITFRSESVRKTTGEDGKPVYEATGPLTMHGVTKQATLPMTFLGEGPGPYGNYRTGFLCRTSFKRSDFGMNFMVGPIGDNVGVTISFEGIRQ
ncbi:MAG: YceI family protein [Planctomycetota bacterium]